MSQLTKLINAREIDVLQYSNQGRLGSEAGGSEGEK